MAAALGGRLAQARARVGANSEELRDPLAAGQLHRVLYACALNGSQQRPARGGERAPESGPSGLRLRPATVTPLVAYPPTGRATLRGAALRKGAAWRVLSPARAQA